MVETTVLKSKYGDDIRKRQLHHHNDLSITDLVLKIQNLYGISSNTAIQLKYKDEDGDLVTLADDDDLLIALQDQKTLFVQVTTGETKSDEASDESSVKAPAATIDPSRHEQIESNGIVSHSQENGNNPSLNETVKSEPQELENVPIDDKPAEQQQQLYQQPPVQPTPYNPAQQYHGYGGPQGFGAPHNPVNPPVASTPVGFPPQSTPVPSQVPSQPTPTSFAGYTGQQQYQQPPPSHTPVPTQTLAQPPQQGFQSYQQPLQQQPPVGHPQQPPPSSGFQPIGAPPGGIAPPPGAPPAGGFPGSPAFNPFARGAPPAQQQPGAFNRPQGFGNY